MTLSLFVLAALCAVNTPRARFALPGGDEVVEPVAGLGALIAAVALVPIAVLAEPLLDVLDVSAATARIAAGVLLLVTGLLWVGWPMPRSEPALPGRRAALVPVAFPVLLTPGLALLVLVGAADHGPLTAVLVEAVALASLPALARVPKPSAATARVLAGLARLLAAGLVLAGFALLFDGVYDI